MEIEQNRYWMSGDADDVIIDQTALLDQTS